MSAKYSFLPWLRQGISSILNTNDDLGSGSYSSIIPPHVHRAEVTVALTVSGSTTPISQDVSLVSPGDIVGIDRRNILRVYPEPNVGNFESNYFPFIEFYQDTFCWDYTPAGPNQSNDKRLRPWLALVVLAEDEHDFIENPNGPLDYFKIATTTSQGAVLPPHTETWAWAHVQANVDIVTGSANISESIGELKSQLETEPDFAVARLMCPRRLTPNTRYTAFVIPAFEVGRLAGLYADAADIEIVDPLQPAWGQGASFRPDEFPIYHKWDFATGPAGDFESLVRSLKARTIQDVGYRDFDVQEPSPYGIPGIDTPFSTLDLGGSIRPVGIPYSDFEGADAEAFQEALADLLNLNAYYPYPDVALIPNLPSHPFSNDTLEDDPIITPPLYGGWHVLRTTIERSLAGGSPENLWLRTLNLDPRHRAAAGIGAKVIQENQDKYLAEAWRQVGSILEANRLLRMSQLGVEIVTRITERHLPTDDAADLLPLINNMLPHLGCGGVSLFHTIEASSFPKAALDPAFQKIARPRGRIRRKFYQKLNQGKLPVDHSAVAIANRGTQSITTRIINGDIKWIPEKEIAPEKNRVNPKKHFNGIKLKEEIKDGKTGTLFEFEYQPLTFKKGKPIFPKPKDPKDERDPKDGRDPKDPRDPDNNDHSYFSKPLLELLCDMLENVPVEKPRPALDIAAIQACLDSDFNPGERIKERAIGNIGRDVALDTLVPVLACPDYKDPMYEKLLELDLNLFLPGIEKLPNNTITLLEPNQEFIESYMVGLNVEMNRELLYNEFPSDGRCTSFRQFWDVSGFIDWEGLSAEALEEKLKDIPKINLWDRFGELGSHNHRVPFSDSDPDDTTSQDDTPLILTTRGDFLKRYPDASIFAIKAIDDGSGTLSLSTDPADEKYPIYTANIDPDLSFFGFELTADKARGDGTSANPGWFFVIKEPPAGPRFGFDITPDSGSSPTLGSWNDMDWGHVIDSNGFASPGAIVPSPSSPGSLDDVASWGDNSADIAYVSYQVPFMMAIHATQMLDGL